MIYQFVCVQCADIQTSQNPDLPSRCFKCGCTDFVNDPFSKPYLGPHQPRRSRPWKILLIPVFMYHAFVMLQISQHHQRTALVIDKVKRDIATANRNTDETNATLDLNKANTDELERLSKTGEVCVAYDPGVKNGHLTKEHPRLVLYHWRPRAQGVPGGGEPVVYCNWKDASADVSWYEIGQLPESEEAKQARIQKILASVRQTVSQTSKKLAGKTGPKTNTGICNTFHPVGPDGGGYIESIPCNEALARAGSDPWQDAPRAPNRVTNNTWYAPAEAGHADAGTTDGNVATGFHMILPTRSGGQVYIKPIEPKK